MKNHRASGFTLLEIVIVMAVISIVVGIAAPTWLRQRELSRATACQENLAKIHSAVEVYTLEFKLSNGSAINFPDDLVDPGSTGGAGQGYLRGVPICAAGGTYSVSEVGVNPACTIGATIADYPPHILE